MARRQLISIQERESLADAFQERVNELTFPELANLSKIEKNKELKQIKKQLKSYLINYEQTALYINNATANLDLDNGKNRSLNLYILYKSLSNANIASLLQDGYILIETLRKTFTGNEIEYEVGMEYSISRGKRQLINKKITLAQLLSYAKVDIDWGSSGIQAFKLRASSNKNDFNAEYEKQKEMIELLIGNTHSLYPKVQTVLSSSKNKGNVYEVYQQLKYSGWADHAPGPKNPNELTSQNIIDKYIEVKKGTQSFVSGGDFGLTQFKLLSSAPSIATLGTIGNALKLILFYIEKGETANITIENIKNNVFSNQFDNLMKQGLNELIQDINDELDNSIPFKS